MAIYVCSDIHGFYDRYIKMLEKINFSDEDTLYVLGDVIDRGPDGIKILQDMMTRKNIEMFIGNHEFMMLEYLKEVEENGYAKHVHWLYEGNGGQITLSDFSSLSKKEQNEILKYLNNAYMQKVIHTCDTDFMLCHTFFNRTKQEFKFKDAASSEIDMMVWYSPFRDDELNIPYSYYTSEYIYVIGHVPTIRFGQEAPMIYKNIIDIDGGCAISAFKEGVGTLCCVRLDTLYTDNPFIINIK